MAETCDVTSCTAAPVYTLSLLRAPAPGKQRYESVYQDRCADHATFRAARVGDSVRVDAFSPISHHRLLGLVKRLPEDYAPWGQADRGAGEGGLDCSCGCRYFAPLDGKLGSDWGVCCSPASPRSGLLTFEHQNGLTCCEPVGEEED